MFTGLGDGTIVLPVRLPASPASRTTSTTHTNSSDLRVTTVERTADERQRAQRRRVKERRRQKALDRSRRNSNPDQYHPSSRQEKAAKRRAGRDAPPAAVARRDTARRIAGDLVAVHGTDLTIETGSIAAWAKTWGRAVHAFTPGLLVAAIEREVAAIRPCVRCVGQGPGARRCPSTACAASGTRSPSPNAPTDARRAD